MKILTIDVGTGTQDIYLYNSSLDMENNYKLVLPSPTMIIRQQIRQATERGEAVLLDGVTMGGGPCAWAAEDHLREGFAVYATPEAARTINDDLEAVTEMGVILVAEDEAKTLPGSIRRMELKDFDFPSIARAFEIFGVPINTLDAVVVAVFDHGNAPPDISDRKFRFDYLDDRIRKFNRLSAFAHLASNVPSIMTRLQAVVKSGQDIDFPLVVMDTAPAAVLGATLDPAVSSRKHSIIANIGNFHTLAFRLGPGGIEGLFEHHTGLVDADKIDSLLARLADGTLRREDVFNDHGHGALVYDSTPLPPGQGDFDIVITGPRRNLFHPLNFGSGKSRLRPYFPAPFGDMMITGCFGLLAAVADVIPDLGGTIWKSLSQVGGTGTTPWDALQN